MFPAEILPIVTVLANLVHFLLGLPILVAFLIYFDTPLQVAELAWFPVVVLVQLLLTVSLALILSALTVHFRDIKDILANVMTLWFFATPILYYWDDAPPQIRRFLDLNPFTHLAISYQEILYFKWGTSVTGSGSWHSALARRCSSFSRIFCSIASAIRSPRKCDA